MVKHNKFAFTLRSFWEINANLIKTDYIMFPTYKHKFRYALVRISQPNLVETFGTKHIVSFSITNSIISKTILYYLIKIKMIIRLSNRQILLSTWDILPYSLSEKSVTKLADLLSLFSSKYQQT